MSHKISIVLIALLVLVGTGYVACAQVYDSYAIRYKVTVNIETPEGIKSGSAIHEVSNSASNIKIIDLPEAGNPAEFRGEAVVVDLGKRGQVFALLKTDAYWELYDAFPIEGASTLKGIKYYKSLKSGDKAVLPERAYPQFVRFADINDPKSVELVLDVQQTETTPFERKIKTNRLEELFGQGVKLQDIQIEVTDEPVTWGIEKWVPWLPGRKDIKGSLGGSPDKPFEDPTGLYLTGVEFSKGRFW